MNKHLIKEAQELCEAATPGPWEVGNGTGKHWYHGDNVVVSAERCIAGMSHSDEQVLADMRFIARSRTLIPELVAALEEEIIRGDRNWARIVAIREERDRLRVRAEIAETLLAKSKKVLTQSRLGIGGQ